MNTSTHPSSPNIGALEALRDVPPRNAAAVAAGRAAFLAQAQEMRQAFAAPASRSKAGGRWRIPFTIFLAALLGSAGVVYAAQSSLPDQALYRIKILTEDAQLSLTSDTQTRYQLLTSFAARREVELAQLGTTAEGAIQAQARLRAHQAEAARLATALSLEPTDPPTLASPTATITVAPTPKPVSTKSPTATIAPASVTPSATATPEASATAVTAVAPSETPIPLKVATAAPGTRTPNPTGVALRATATALAIPRPLSTRTPNPTGVALRATATALAISQPLITRTPNPTGVALRATATARASTPIAPPPASPAPSETPFVDLRATAVVIRATLTTLPLADARATIGAIRATATAMAMPPSSEPPAASDTPMPALEQPPPTEAAPTPPPPPTEPAPTTALAPTAESPPPQLPPRFATRRPRP